MSGDEPVADARRREIGTEQRIDNQEYVIPFSILTIRSRPSSARCRDPNGLLAAGADLSPERLLDAYAHGIFPWFGEEDPVLWWSPDPRMVLFTSASCTSRDRCDKRSAQADSA